MFTAINSQDEEILKEIYSFRGVRVQQSKERTMTLLYFSDVSSDPCTFISVCSQWCEETCSLSVISNALTSGEWQSCFSLAPCHPKHDPFSLAPCIKCTSRPPGVYRSEVGLAQINLHSSGAWRMCVTVGVCYQSRQSLGWEKKKGRRKKKKKNIFSWIICLTPPVLWNIKEHLPVPFSREKCQRSACPLWCALKSGRIGRCYPTPPTLPPSPPRFTETCLCPDIAHLCTPQRPASLQPSVLTHYRSSWQHHKWQNSVHFIPPMVYFCTRQSVTCNNTWRVWIDSV